MARAKTTRTKTPRKGRKAPAQAAAPKTAAEISAASATTAKKAVDTGVKVATDTAKAAETVAHMDPTPRTAKAARVAGKSFDDLVAVSQDNLEAYMTSSSIVAKGMEILGKEVMAVTQAGLEENLTATQQIMTAKSLREVIDVQTGITQLRLERMADEATRFSALSMRVASQAIQPLQDRFDAGVRMAARPFAL